MRRCYLVCYDVRDDKRLRRVHKLMKAYGEAWQYSVFYCTLKPIDRVRLVADSDAVGVVLMDPNKTHPYRLKEVVAEVNRRLPEGAAISAYDLLGIRRLYQTDLNRVYRYKPNTGSGQYSDALVQWIVDQTTSNHAFLPTLRQRHYQWITQENTRRHKAAPPPPVDWAYRRL